MCKRLTKRDKYGQPYTNKTIYDRGMTSADGKTYEKHYFENGTSAYDGKPIDRLCELEDKIEQGELVEVVRCKDCEWYREVQGYEYKGRKAMCCLTHSGLRYETDYCNYGVRREDTE